MRLWRGLRLGGARGDRCRRNRWPCCPAPAPTTTRPRLRPAERPAPRFWVVWVSVRERAAGVLWAAGSQGHDGRLGASSGNEVDRCTPNVRHAAATLVLAASANSPPVAGPVQTSKTYRTPNCREHSETDQRNLRGDAGGYLGPAPRAS